MPKALWTVVACIVVGWLVGVVFKLFEGAIHLLLIPAGIVAAIALVVQRGGGSGPETAPE